MQKIFTITVNPQNKFLFKTVFLDLISSQCTKEDGVFIKIQLSGHMNSDQYTIDDLSTLFSDSLNWPLKLHLAITPDQKQNTDRIAFHKYRNTHPPTCMCNYF